MGDLHIATNDPFASLDATSITPSTTASSKETSLTSSIPNVVHIRIRPYKGRKNITSVEGLNPAYNFNKILKAFRKDFCCSGAVKVDGSGIKTIQLQGDQRQQIAKWLIKNKLVKKKSQIKVHGSVI
eukprot:gnl/Dysnectes_brevis/105_a126_11979.p1 GENE.gnl/Dysnectes_brevis/105_a126_11979~~gnl/Dysnectes_brevis/105_a126_11979.p1  ORF type:complete len:137 (-),score=14.79 gnl/Dysnectes_brevis/105_a126_11979:65-445(-)